MKKILCIGPCSNPNTNYFTGQSVMFDGIIVFLKKNKFDLFKVNISPNFKSNSLVARLFDYIIILVNLILKLTFNKFQLCYITTSQSKKGFYRDLILVTLCKWYNIPIIAHQYGANLNQLTESLDKIGISKLVNMLSYIQKIIVEGEYMKEQYAFLPEYQSKVVVIPNGLPIEGHHVNIPKKVDNKKPFVIFYLSNLIWSKGYFDLLESLDILINKYRLNIKCIFAGKFMSSIDDESPNISNKEKFDNYILNHGLSQFVEYHPGLYGEIKDEYFFNSHVFVLPTYYINEGQPVSIIEAMSYGCVPIVTEYRHIPMMINETNGCFVLPKSPYDIAEKIKALITQPENYEKKSKQCINDYQQKFKYNIYASKVMNVINTVVVS